MANHTISALGNEDRQTLLEVARNAISYELYQYVAIDIDPNAYSPSLREMRATFVTIQIEGKLRGCIGTLEMRRSLVMDVARNAGAAAFADPRFERLTRAEFDLIDIHISILSPVETVVFDGESDIVSKVRPNIDGLILSDGPHRGTFLPEVWEKIPDPSQFIEQLKMKAGLAPDYWSDSIQVERYTTETIP